MSTLNVAFNDNTVNTEVHLGFKQTSKHEQHAATESANQNATESANQNATATSNTNKLNEDSSVSLGRQLWDMCPGFGVASYPIISSASDSNLHPFPKPSTKTCIKSSGSKNKYKYNTCGACTST